MKREEESDIQIRQKKKLSFWLERRGREKKEMQNKETLPYQNLFNTELNSETHTHKIF